jgi:hypothetical protein
VLLNSVTTSPSTFLICGHEHCFLDFLMLHPNLCLFNLSLLDPVANSTSLKIRLCVIEHLFCLKSTMASSFDATTTVHLRCFASNLERGCNPINVLSWHTYLMYSTTVGCPSCFSLIYTWVFKGKQGNPFSLINICFNFFVSCTYLKLGVDKQSHLFRWI